MVRLAVDDVSRPGVVICMATVDEVSNAVVTAIMGMCDM
jgi:hypothetical protein